MAALLDHIFYTLEITTLDRARLQEYMVYLQEIDPQLTSIDDRLKFQRIKVRLDNRLLELDRELVMRKQEK